MENLRKLTPVGDGDFTFFKECESNGFLLVSFGGGPWIDALRLVRVWALFHPNGRVVAYEQWKMDDGVATIHSSPEKKHYSEEEFSELLKKWGVSLGAKTPLRELLDKWPEDLK